MAELPVHFFYGVPHFPQKGVALYSGKLSIFQYFRYAVGQDTPG